jgi:hypothetical protein
MKRPTTYVEWRRIFQGTVYSVGFVATCKFARDGRISVDRDFYRLLHRHRRLKRRMEAEWEAMDSTCAAALLHLVFSKEH